MFGNQLLRALCRAWPVVISVPMLVGFSARGADAYELLRTAYSGAAVAASNGTYSLGATLGEAGVVGVASGQTYDLSEGFWGNVYRIIATDAPEFPESSIHWVNGLRNNFPNPFGSATTIEYSVAHTSPVKLTIYNVLGRRISTLIHGPVGPGSHRVIWNGRDTSGRLVGSGVYFYRLDIGPWSQTRKMLKLN